jgi:hypothetical protein
VVDAHRCAERDDRPNGSGLGGTGWLVLACPSSAIETQPNPSRANDSQENEFLTEKLIEKVGSMGKAGRYTDTDCASAVASRELEQGASRARCDGKMLGASQSSVRD